MLVWPLVKCFLDNLEFIPILILFFPTQTFYAMFLANQTQQTKTQFSYKTLQCTLKLTISVFSSFLACQSERLMGHWNQPMKYLEMKNLGKHSSKMNYLRSSLNSKEMLQNWLHFLFRATFIFIF